MHQLEIFIVQNCFGSEYAINLASEITQRFPRLEVRIFDLARPNIRKPESVFAVPTYIFDNSIVWLGNPDKNEFLEKLRTLLL